MTKRHALYLGLFCRFACAFINCPEYGKTWQNKYGVYSHWQNEHMESIENPVQCPQCPKKLISTVMLKMHMQQVHYKLEGNKFSCAVRGIVKDSLGLLRSHEAIHQTVSISCEFCDYTTNAQKKLRVHQRYAGHQTNIFQCVSTH